MTCHGDGNRVSKRGIWVSSESSDDNERLSQPEIASKGAVEGFGLSLVYRSNHSSQPWIEARESKEASSGSRGVSGLAKKRDDDKGVVRVSEGDCMIRGESGGSEAELSARKEEHVVDSSAEEVAEFLAEWTCKFETGAFRRGRGLIALEMRSSGRMSSEGAVFTDKLPASPELEPSVVATICLCSRSEEGYCSAITGGGIAKIL